MRFPRASYLVATALLVACGAKDRAPPRSTTVSASIRALSTPPSAKDIVNAALESATVPLSVHKSCAAIGTEQLDATLGRFLSGFLAELNPESGKNGIVTSVREVDDGWVCRLMIQHRAGEDVWSWGLEFKFGKDGLLVPDSYRCVGAG